MSRLKTFIKSPPSKSVGYGTIYKHNHYHLKVFSFHVKSSLTPHPPINALNIVSSYASTSNIPPLRRLNRILPIRPCQKPSLNPRYQSQRYRNTTPQPFQLPSPPESRPETNRHGNNIVAEEVHVAANFLTTETTEEAVCVGGKSVEELEGGANG
jgi:hypothetical protein